MNRLKSLRSDRFSIIYDGECPFCTSYVRLVQLRESVGTVDLIDGRIQSDIVSELQSLGFDINNGMVVQYDNVLYFGSDAMNIIANLSTNSGIWNRIISWSLRRRYMSKHLYPVFRAIRNITLKILQRQPIPNKFNKNS